MSPSALRSGLVGAQVGQRGRHARPPADDARSYADAMPWLHDVRGDERDAVLQLGGDRWWLGHAAPVELVGAGSRLASLAEIVLEHRPAAPLGEIVAVPTDSFPLALLPDLGVRATNALARVEVRTVRDLLALRVDQLTAMWAVGRLTVVNVITSLMGFALQREIGGWSPYPDEQPRVEDRVTPGTSSRAPRLDVVLVDDLVLLARWRHLVGDSDVPLLTHPGAEAPPQVQEAFRRTMGMAADAVLPRSAVDLEGDAAAQALEDALGRLGARYHEVGRLRTFAAAPMTLELVGQQLGVTRERVRQLEQKVRRRLASQTVIGTPAGDLLASLRSRLRPVARLDALVGAAPALGREVTTAGAPVWRVLDRLDDDFEVLDGWAATPSVGAAIASTRSAVEDLDDDHGVAPLAAVLADVLPGLPRDEAVAWLRSAGLDVRDHAVLTRTSSIPDLAAAVLAIAGVPLDLDVLVARLEVERSPKSIRAALFADDRFARTDRDQWALSEWGHEAYAPISTLVQRELDRAGGEVALNVLVQTLTERFSIAASSVQAYASGHPFRVDAGIVRRDERERASHKGPYDTRRLYRVDHGWRYRVDLTHEHVRGSGSQLPVGLASAIGLARGGSMALPSRLGDQTVAWRRMQPTLGSVGRFVPGLGAAEGDPVHLVFEDGTFDVVPTRAPRHTAGWERAAALVGIPPLDRPATVSALATAVGLSSDASRRAIARRYRARGDEDVASLLDPPRGLDDPGQDDDAA